MPRPRTGSGPEPAQNGGPRRVLAYCRVSGAEQGRVGTSLDAQREEIARYCQAHRYPTPDVRVEVESAGAEKLERRAVLRRLLADVRDGDLVIVAKQDRFSRDTLFYLQATRDIVARGARFYSLAERFDPETPEGRFAATIMAAVAEQERERIRERTVGRRKALRAEGAYIEGSIPLGYKRDGRTLAIDEETAPIMRDMFARLAAGESGRSIAAAFAELYPGIGGLDHSGICRKARNRVYLGEVHPTAGRRARAGDTWIAAHPPLVDRATWARAQAELTRHRLYGRPPGSTSRTVSHLLRGLVRCGACGHVLGSHHPGDRVGLTHTGYYFCHGRAARSTHPCRQGARARQDGIDAAADAATLEHLASLAAVLARPEQPAASRRGKIDLGAKRQRVVAARARVVDAIAAGVITIDQARGKLAELDAAALRIDREEAADAPPEAPRPRRERLAEVRQMARAWAALETAEKREVIARLAETITITSAGKLRIRWRSA